MHKMKLDILKVQRKTKQTKKAEKLCSIFRHVRYNTCTDFLVFPEICPFVPNIGIISGIQSCRSNIFIESPHPTFAAVYLDLERSESQGFCHSDAPLHKNGAKRRLLHLNVG